MQVACPYCDGVVPAASPGGGEPAPGEIVDCPHCDRSFALARPDAPFGPDATPPRLRGARRLRAATPTDVSLSLTGLAAAVATALFYLGVVVPLRGTYLGELFGNRGWVQHAITFLTFWSVAILALKYRALASQAGALEADLLPARIAERITPENAHVFASFLRGLPEHGKRNFLVDRVERALHHFRARRRALEVVDQLGAQAQADASAVASSYTMIKVLIWAIPILGFIGTVIGIGAAVGGFSSAVAAAVDLEVMKDSIGTVTTGLGVAFDTTLLALVMSLGIMFPASSLEKAEEDFLAAVEDWCDENLVRRLDDGLSAADAEALQRRLAEEMSRQRALTEEMVKGVNRLADAVDELRRA
jgi:biopolymer transport protein ExbB/TolQ